MINIPNKNNNDPTTLEYAEEFNSIKNELMNSVSSTGQPLESSPGLNTQIASSLAYYSASGSYYQAGGANVNNYIATVVGSYKGINDYLPGMRFRISIGQSNTGSCTLQINGLGTYAILKYNQSGGLSGLNAGDIIGGKTITVDYIQSSPNHFLLVDNGIQRIEQVNVESCWYTNTNPFVPLTLSSGSTPTTVLIPYNVAVYESRPGMYNTSTNAFYCYYPGVYEITTPISLIRSNPSGVLIGGTQTSFSIRLVYNSVALKDAAGFTDVVPVSINPGVTYYYPTATNSAILYLNQGDSIQAYLTYLTDSNNLAPFFINFNARYTAFMVKKL